MNDAETTEANREIPNDVEQMVAVPRPGYFEQLDLFVADIFDASPKDDLASMEHPLFALKAGDREIRRYERGTTYVEVRPGVNGLATIHDKDLWIYAISQLMAAANAGERTGRLVQFTAYDFLKATKRGTSGRSYERLGKALERLAETRVVTNIHTGGSRSRQGFGLLDSFEIVERHPDDGRMVAIQMTLPDWLYRAVTSRECLTLHREYFSIRKPLERRIYELARKHCGRQGHWSAKLKTLHQKSGTRASTREFRRSIKDLIGRNDLPGYRVQIDDTDTVTFYARTNAGGRAEFKALTRTLQR